MNDPDGHSTHVAEPQFAAIEPLGHGKHASILLAPITCEANPGAHGVQIVKLVFEYVPLGQAVHCAEALDEMLPGRHARQVDRFVAPIWSE